MGRSWRYPIWGYRLRHRYRAGGPDVGCGSGLRGASQIYAVGSREVCVEAARKYGATTVINYRDGDIADQINDLNLRTRSRSGHHRGRRCRYHLASAVRMLKPGGVIGNVNYLGEGEYVRIPRAEWGAGMGTRRLREV